MTINGTNSAKMMNILKLRMMRVEEVISDGQETNHRRSQHYPMTMPMDLKIKMRLEEQTAIML